MQFGCDKRYIWRLADWRDSVVSSLFRHGDCWSARDGISSQSEPGPPRNYLNCIALLFLLLLKFKIPYTSEILQETGTVTAKWDKRKHTDFPAYNTQLPYTMEYHNVIVCLHRNLIIPNRDKNSIKQVEENWQALGW